MEDSGKTSPASKDSRKPNGSVETVATVQEEEVVNVERLQHIHYDTNLHRTAFVGKVASNEDIKTFLDSCELYDSAQKKWTAIQRGEPAPKLRATIQNVIHAILKNWDSSGSTAVVDANGRRLFHAHDPSRAHDAPPLKSSPDLAIERRRSDFAPERMKQSKLESKFYSCVVSPLEIETEMISVEQHITQTAIYARQIFIHQKNRHRVYGLVISQRHVRLYMFDRCGVSYSKQVDFHQDPVAFVRFVLGVGASEDAVAGLDTSIYWSRENSRLQLDTVDRNNKPIALELAQFVAFHRPNLTDRGTCCWIAAYPGGKVVIVKDAWCSDYDKLEQELLRRARGLAGVVQMISYEEGVRVSEWRGVDATELGSSFIDRTFCRITLEFYGPTISRFNSREELLFAFRDAIAGHQNLWNAGILHRDISTHNILIGLPGSRAGNRGVLIDLDMSIFVDEYEDLLGDNGSAGTRPFQSVNVLLKRVPRDHFDDLESFFYVLCWICLGYAGPGKRIKPFPLTSWEVDAESVGNTKAAFLFRPLDQSIVQEWYGPVFRTLLVKMHDFFKEVSLRINREERSEDDLTRVQKRAVKDYATILGFVDTAIAELAIHPVASKELKGAPARVPMVEIERNTESLPKSLKRPPLELQAPGAASRKKVNERP